MKKRGQMKISFSMIFAILLIIIFIIFAFFGIRKFVEINENIKSKKIVVDVQDEINKVLKTASSSQEESFSVPEDVVKLCFEQQPEDSEDDNFYSIPRGIVGGILNGINWANTNPSGEALCVDVGKYKKISFSFEKDYGEKLVTVGEGDLFVSEELEGEPGIHGGEEPEEPGIPGTYGSIGVLDCENIDTNKFNVIFCQNFENTPLGDYEESEIKVDFPSADWHYPISPGSLRIEDEGGNNLMRNYLFEGTFGLGEGSGIDWYMPLQDQSQEELYVSVKVKFSENLASEYTTHSDGTTDHYLAGKFPAAFYARYGGWSSPGNKPGPDEGYLTLTMFHSNTPEDPDKLEIAFYVYHENMECNSGICDDDDPNNDIYYGEGAGIGYLEPNKWYTVTQRMVMNDPGQSNGILQYFIDGKLVASYNHYKFRETHRRKIEFLNIANFLGGSGYPPYEDAWWEFDDFVVFNYKDGSSPGEFIELPYTETESSSEDEEPGTVLPGPSSTEISQLKVSSNGRFLVKEDGTPFFYLGDTAWRMPMLLTREEVDFYIQKRKQQGFNVVMITLEGTTFGEEDLGNAYGDLAYLNRDFNTPRVLSGVNNDYWDHLDYIINKAEENGLYVALMPLWSNAYLSLSESEYRTIGEFVGNRYKNKENIIWITGGDQDPEGYESLFRAMAEGITKGVTGSNYDSNDRVLITYHPCGWYEHLGYPHSSSGYLYNEDWLDMNGIQSGHFDAEEPPLLNYKYIERDYAKSPEKPTFEMESFYEGHPFKLTNLDRRGNDFDVRRNAYWSVFAGGFGYTYGNNNVWPFYTSGMDTGSHSNLDWHDALDATGANDMIHLKNLMLSQGSDAYLRRIPYQELIATYNPDGIYKMYATMDSQGTYAFIYIPESGKDVTIDTSKLSGTKITSKWYNPRDGTSKIIESGVTKISQKIYTTPTSSGPDWVLVITSS